MLCPVEPPERYNRFVSRGSITLSETCSCTERHHHVVTLSMNLSHKLHADVQVSTVAGWSKIFYRSADNTNVSSLVYFLGIVIFVSYILSNLFLAGADLLYFMLCSNLHTDSDRLPPAQQG